MRTTMFLSIAAALFLTASCIVCDQITTLTIRPDGSADWVRFQSNLHSSESGAKGAEELQRFAADFDQRADPDCTRLVEAGGEILGARWIRRESPCATLVEARLPDAAALEKFCTLHDETGVPVSEARFTRDGSHCRLSITVNADPTDAQTAASSRPDQERTGREKDADGISQTRVVVTDGTILAERGFVVAADRRSALLDPDEIEDLVRTAKWSIELFLEWQIEGE